MDRPRPLTPPPSADNSVGERRVKQGDSEDHTAEQEKPDKQGVSPRRGTGWIYLRTLVDKAVGILAGVELDSACCLGSKAQPCRIQQRAEGLFWTISFKK